MKICIDARTAHIGGIRTYSVNLLTSLISIDNHNEYFIFYDQRMAEMGLAGVNEYVVPTMNELVWIAWSQTALPRFLKKMNIDVFHSVKQVGAIWSKTKKILTIHDAGFFCFLTHFHGRKLSIGKQCIVLQQKDTITLLPYQIPQDILYVKCWMCPMSKQELPILV